MVAPLLVLVGLAVAADLVRDGVCGDSPETAVQACRDEWVVPTAIVNGALFIAFLAFLPFAFLPRPDEKRERVEPERILANAQAATAHRYAHFWYGWLWLVIPFAGVLDVAGEEFVGLVLGPFYFGLAATFWLAEKRLKVVAGQVGFVHAFGKTAGRRTAD